MHIHICTCIYCTCGIPTRRRRCVPRRSTYYLYSPAAAPAAAKTETDERSRSERRSKNCLAHTDTFDIPTRHLGYLYYNVEKYFLIRIVNVKTNFKHFSIIVFSFFYNLWTRDCIFSSINRYTSFYSVDI